MKRRQPCTDRNDPNPCAGGFATSTFAGFPTVPLIDQPTWQRWWWPNVANFKGECHKVWQCSVVKIQLPSRIGNFFQTKRSRFDDAKCKSLSFFFGILCLDPLFCLKYYWKINWRRQRQHQPSSCWVYQYGLVFRFHWVGYIIGWLKTVEQLNLFQGEAFLEQV